MKIDLSKFHDYGLTTKAIQEEWFRFIQEGGKFDRFAQNFWNTYGRFGHNYPDFYYRTDHEKVYVELMEVVNGN